MEGLVLCPQNRVKAVWNALQSLPAFQTNNQTSLERKPRRGVYVAIWAYEKNLEPYVKGKTD